MNFRLLVAILIAILPPRLHRVAGRLLLGWQVDSSCYVGHSVIAAKKVVMAPGSAIGSLNMIKGLEELNLAAGASIGFFNWISGPSLESGAYPNSPKRRPALLMDEGATILQRHIVDCSDTVRFGKFAALGGYRSTILSHNVNLVTNRLLTTPVTLHDHCVVMSHCVIAAGVSIAERSVVSAGSVINTPLTRPGAFYRGNPAVVVRDLPENLKFTKRTGPAL